MASNTHLPYPLKPPKHSIFLLSGTFIASYRRPLLASRRRIGCMQARQRHLDTVAGIPHTLPSSQKLLGLPKSCPGCGAFTQAISFDQPGFYSTHRKSVKGFTSLYGTIEERGQIGTSEAFEHVVCDADAVLLSQLGSIGSHSHGNGTDMQAYSRYYID